MMVSNQSTVLGGPSFSNLFHLFRDSPDIAFLVQTGVFCGHDDLQRGWHLFPVRIWGRSMRDSKQRTHPLARWVPILISLVLIVMCQAARQRDHPPRSGGLW